MRITTLYVPRSPVRNLLPTLVLLCFAHPAWSETDIQDTRPGIAPDIREDKAALSFKDGDFVVVPIPISGPTLGTGLVGGAAYFYPQSEEEKKIEPASVTGLGGMYSSNDSVAAALFHQGYWGRNKWRFTGGIGAASVNIELVQPDEETGVSRVDWNISGTFGYFRLSRKIAGNWYGGAFVRTIFARQDLVTDAVEDQDFNTDDSSVVGIGLRFEYDSRDLPINTYKGVHFEASGLFNDEAVGSDDTYQAYSAKFRSYHQVKDELILAWEVQSCRRSGSLPLWDACRIPLRGFAAFDYLGKVSITGQASLRWNFSRRWGVVGFAGAGNVSDSYTTLSEDRSIPSYGAGIRFSVLPAKRVNLRVDYAWSRDDNAVHIGVGEYF